MLWMFMGSGKTAVTLTTATHLLEHSLIKGVLVLGPLRVVQSVWEKEARKWEHTQGLTFSSITGTPERRMSALFKPADIYLTNYDNLAWLSAQLQAYFIQQGLPMPFDMLVADEISKLKNANTGRMQALQPLLPGFNYRTGLTGTPAANGYIDLHGQYLTIDDGLRLGADKTAYEDAYFKPVGYGGYSYEIAEESQRIIEANIADITLEMSEEDYIDLPDFLIQDLHAQMPPAARKQYDKMEREMFAELDDGALLEVDSEVGKINKCIGSGTKVLTLSGWIPIERLNGNEFIWDGIEWVSYYGLALQGIKETVKCFNVKMTSDHKVLTTSGWATAEEINNGESCERYVRSEVWIPNRYKTTRVRIREQGQQICASVMAMSMRLWENCSETWNKSAFKTSNKNKLQVVDHTGTSKQHAIQCLHRHTRWQNDDIKRRESLWGKGSDVTAEGSGGLVNGANVDTRNKVETYDLINCGPRNRFVVMGSDGAPLIVHNCLQMSNGAAYIDVETREWKRLHDAKLDVLEDILEEAAGNPVLLGYNFRTDAERICKKFKFAVNLTGLTGKEFNKAIEDFSAGRIKLLLGHPASIGHGTDGLQHGGSILVWFGLPWSLELYLQLNKRLHRQGQGKPVTCYRIICPNTMDEVVSAKLEMKDDTQQSLRAAIGAYRKGK